MTNDEMKTALLNGEKVICELRSGGEAEMKMHGIIYRSDGKGGIKVSAELLDLNGNSITICNPQNIKKFDKNEVEI